VRTSIKWIGSSHFSVNTIQITKWRGDNSLKESYDK